MMYWGRQSVVCNVTAVQYDKSFVFAENRIDRLGGGGVLVGSAIEYCWLMCGTQLILLRTTVVPVCFCGGGSVKNVSARNPIGVHFYDALPPFEENLVGQPGGGDGGGSRSLVIDD